jgi:hypothetical protein
VYIAQIGGQPPNPRTTTGSRMPFFLTWLSEKVGKIEELRYDKRDNNRQPNAFLKGIGYAEKEKILRNKCHYLPKKDKSSTNL